MIDSFWTKWRIKQLARGEVLLVGKWLEDYARWLYGRAWYRCGGDQQAIQRLLEETFVSAAGRLKECLACKSFMSEWLLSVYEQIPVRITDVNKARLAARELREAIGCLSIQPLSETDSYWPEMTRYSGQALAMSSCDEQCLLMCRYFRLERPSNTAAQYDMDLPEIQNLLYRASHSFRRILETLVGPAAEEIMQRGQMDSAILEANLEKIFRTLVPESPSLELMESLKKRVLAVLGQNNLRDRSTLNRNMLFASASGIILCGVLFVLFWYGIFGSAENKDTIKASQAKQPDVKKDNSAVPPVEAAAEVQLAMRLGTTRDVEGLLGILRTGTYPAQIAAAHYLGQFGDESAINLLDKASQKWYTNNSAGTNPFIEAISAIENRMRLKARQELQAKAQSLLTRKPTVQEAHQPVVKQEPNHLSKPAASEVQPPHGVTPPHEVLPQEPNSTEPPLIIRMEPNQPPMVEEVNQPASMEDVNLPILEEIY